MAITVAPVSPQGVTLKKWSIIATADGDTASGNIAHGFGVAPFAAWVQPVTPAGSLSVWAVTTNDATNLVVTKGTTAGSGAAPIQAYLYAMLPHSLIA